MSTDNAMKISADHLRRDAFLYVRQSSLRQVFENTESTKRQYALRDRAVALGWRLSASTSSTTTSAFPAHSRRTAMDFSAW